LEAARTILPRLITVDKNAAYPPAFEALQQAQVLLATRTFGVCKYLNNVLEPIIGQLNTW
jgi:transposase, IS6 family